MENTEETCQVELNGSQVMLVFFGLLAYKIVMGRFDEEKTAIPHEAVDREINDVWKKLYDVQPNVFKELYRIECLREKKD
jgi:hypothetical protein